MNDIEFINEYYNSVMTELDSLIVENSDSLYGCEFHDAPPNPVHLPHVQHSLDNKSLGRETLDKNERHYPFDISIEIYTENQRAVSRRTIAQEIEKFIAKYMIDECGLTLVYSNPILNLDTNVYRVLMRFSGVLDTSNQIVYRQ